jgi:hypothetical protein
MTDTVTTTDPCPPAPQEGLTEGQKLLTGSAAVVGFLGAGLMGWGIVGGLIAARSDERQQQGPGGGTP